MARLGTLFVDIRGDWDSFQRQVRRNTARSASIMRSGLGFAVGGAMIGGLYAIGNAFKQTTQEALRFSSKVELISKSWALLDSQAESDKTLNYFRELSEVTPFDIENLLEAGQVMRGYGVPLEKVREVFPTIVDAIAAFGGSNEQLGRVGLALGQVQAKGRVLGEELRQLNEAGVQAQAALGAYLGKTIPEVQNMARRGLISAEDLYDALISYSGPLEDVRGASELASRTLMGALSNIRDAFRNALQKGVEPFQEEITEAFIGFQDTVRGVATAIAPAVSTVLVQGTRLATALAPAFEVFTGIFSEIITGIVDALAPVLAEMEPEITALGEAFLELWTAVEPVLPALVELALVAVPVLTEFFKALVPLMETLVPIFTDFVDDFVRWVEEGLEWIDANLESDIAKVLALGGALFLFFNAFSIGRAAVAAAWGVIGPVLGFLIRTAVPFLLRFLGPVGLLLGTIAGLLFAQGASDGGGIAGGLKAVTDALNPFIEAWEQFKQFVLEEIWPGIQEAWAELEPVWQEMKPYLAEIGGYLLPLLIESLKVLAMALATAAIAVMLLVEWALRTFAEWWERDGENTMETIRGFAAFLATTFLSLQIILQAVMESIFLILTGDWDAIGAVWETAGADLSGVWRQAWPDIETALNNLWEDLQRWFLGKVEDIANLGIGLVDGLEDGVKRRIGERINQILAPFQGIIDALIGMFSIDIGDNLRLTPPTPGPAKPPDKGRGGPAAKDSAGGGNFTQFNVYRPMTSNLNADLQDAQARQRLSARL